MSARAVDLIGMLQEFVSQHGEETAVAVAVNMSRPYRLEITGLAVDQEIREADERERTGPPLVWLITDAPDDDADPYAPRRACIPRVVPDEG